MDLWSRRLHSLHVCSYRPGLSLALLLLTLALLAGCTAGGSDGGVSIGSGGGGSGSGGSGNPPPNPDPTPTPTAPIPVPSLEAMIAWGDASGPVAGYSVLISRNGGSFQLERETPEPRVLLSGAKGDVVRIRVAAFDTTGNSGPLSPPSRSLVFVGPPEDTTGAASSGTPGQQAADAPADPGPGSVVSDASGAGDDPEPSSEDAAPSGPRPRADFDGDGAADLVWESADGSVVRISSADLSSARLYTLPAAGARIVAIADFDADGLSDLLFAVAGELALARGAALPAGPGELSLETWARLDAGAEVVASGDFDADGSADVVVMDAAGASLWLATGDVLALPVLGAASLEGAGDGDGDGSDDLIVSDAQGFSLWRVVAGEVVSATSLPAPPGAPLLGVGDFDGDGVDELALRSAPEAMTVQRARTPFGSWFEAAPSGASLAGCGDYDRDGVPDRLWEAADSLSIAGTTGNQQVVALDPESPWRLVHDCGF
jgi:hypothetical protein